MKRSLLTLAFILLPTLAQAFTIAWDAVTTNADNTPITDLAGYHVYACPGAVPCTRTTPGVLGPVVIPPTVTTYTPADQTTVKTWFVTAFDTSGNESGESNSVIAPTDLNPPKKPGNLRIIP